MKNQQLPQFEKYFLAIANTSADMIHLNDNKGRIVYANPATQTFLGYPLNDLINIHAFEIIHIDDHEVIRNDMKELFAESSDGKLPAREIRLRRINGSYIDVEVRGFVVDFDDNKYIGAIIRDISKRKSVEKELESYRNNLEKMVEERTEKLKRALDEIQTLKGILPICSFCKQIRDDKGYWQQVEIYFKEHSQAEFSHSVCPECAKKHYFDLFPEKE